MKTKFSLITASAFLCVALFVTPASSHHSFAMYDQAKTPEGKYVEWGVEMAGAAAVAQQGITASAFGVGTVFSVKVNPLRDGSNFGSRTGAIAKCPMDPATNKPKLPAADKHCDSVPGNTLSGGTTF